MVATCEKKMLKYILVFLNFLFFIVAIVGVITSLVFILKPGTLEKVEDKISEMKKLSNVLSPDTIRAGLYVILAASVIILVISFAGCCGAWKEIKFLLGVYSGLLIIILIIEVAAFIVAIVFKHKLEAQVKIALEQVQKDNTTVYEDFEKKLKCCGVNDGDKCENPSDTWTIGCYNALVKALQKFYTIVLAVSVITVIVEVLLITFSCCLCFSIGENVA